MGKNWANQNEVLGASKGFISSYSLTLMVIYFFQAAYDPPLLPSIQAIAKFNSSKQQTRKHQGKTLDCTLISKDEILAIWAPPAIPSYETLVFDFFDFYGRRFDWDRDLVSVRLGSTAKRSKAFFNYCPGMETSLWIEDPIEVYRNLNDVTTPVGVRTLRMEFRRAHEGLKTHGEYKKLLAPEPRSLYQPRKTAGREDRRTGRTWSYESDTSSLQVGTGASTATQATEKATQPRLRCLRRTCRNPGTGCT